MPEVGRPRGAVWRPLYAEGITWEGQVFIAGGEHDLAARLIVTRSRLALISGGDIALEVPRRWLQPAPRRIGTATVILAITPDGGIPDTRDTDRLSLVVRKGGEEADRLIADLAPRAARPAPIRIDATSSSTWDTRVGAAPAMALPDLAAEPEAFTTTPAPKASWPPVASEAIAPASARKELHPGRRPNESVAAWTAQNLDKPLAPEPEPVPVTYSRAAMKVGTLLDGHTVSDLEVPIVPPTGSRTPVLVRSLQVAILLVMLGTGWYFAGDRLAADYTFSAIGDRVRELTEAARDNGDDDPQTGSQPDIATEAPTTASSSLGDGTGGARDGTDGVDTADTAWNPPTQEDAPGIGGNTGNEDPAPTEEPQGETSSLEDGDGDGVDDEPVVEPTDEPTQEPTQEPTEEPTTEPTQEPTSEPTQEPTSEPTSEPTQEPTSEPTQEPTTEPTSEPTQEPTSEPTQEPTQEPTSEPTDEPIAEATETPATEEPTPEATLEAQEPSIAEGEAPAQETVNGTFRVAVEGGIAGGDITATLPDVTAVTYGEWVVLSVYAQNMSEREQVFDMSQFRLYADGQEIQLDVGNAWVASMLGYTPAYGNTDAILWAPNEGHRFALTFLAPVDAQSLVLQVGDQAIDLSPTLSSNPSLTAPDAAAPEIAPYEATVVEVVDAETIVIEKDGVRQTVKYLGVAVPDSCAEASTEANRALVEGKTVRLERQATDTDAKGNWVRDVWIVNDDGSETLVSQALVSEGALEASISEPNTRFAAWLTASQAAAESAGLGAWSCAAE
jgi:endonuclease YncB( thermonuclease family)